MKDGWNEWMMGYVTGYVCWMAEGFWDSDNIVELDNFSWAFFNLGTFPLSFFPPWVFFLFPSPFFFFFFFFNMTWIKLGRTMDMAFFLSFFWLHECCVRIGLEAWESFFVLFFAIANLIYLSIYLILVPSWAGARRDLLCCACWLLFSLVGRSLGGWGYG